MAARYLDPRDLHVLAGLRQIKRGHDRLRAAGGDTGLLRRPLENKIPHELTICAAADLLWGGTRQGADGVTRVRGDACELKAWDVASSPTPQWASSRDLTRTVLDRYRATPWFFFAIFDGLDLLCLYRTGSHALEPVFARLEARIELFEAGAAKSPNNPKFTLADVEQAGQLIAGEAWADLLARGAVRASAAPYVEPMADPLFVDIAAELLPDGLDLTRADGDLFGRFWEAMLALPTSDAARVGEALIVRVERWPADLADQELWVLRVYGARTARHRGELILRAPAGCCDETLGGVAESLQMALNQDDHPPAIGRSRVNAAYHPAGASRS